MEQYVQQFKDFVLKFLNGKVEQYNLPIHEIALCFYLALAEDKVHIGAGYQTAKNVIHRFVIKSVFDGFTYYLEGKRNDETGEIDYDWSAKMSNDVRTYSTKEDAELVIQSFKFKDAEVVYAGDFTDFYKWVETFPEQPKVSNEKLHIIEHTSIDKIVKIKVVDVLNKRGKFHEIIIRSLFYISQEYKIEDVETKVYAIPDETGKDLNLYIFNGEKYVGWLSIDDLVMGAFMATPPTA